MAEEYEGMTVAELKALLTVTDVELKAEIGFVSTL